MFYSRKKRNIIFTFVSSICIMLTMFLGVMLTTKASVFAETIEVPSYLRITSNSGAFSDQDTVFLDENENLVITLGKPLCDTTAIENGTNDKITKQSDIGDFALEHLKTAFSLKINNIDIPASTLENNGFLTFVPYIYQPSIVDTATGNEIPTGEAQNFMYMTMKIDLSQKTIFGSGEYTFSFKDYLEYSQTNFSLSEAASFSFTLFVFQTTEYFSNNEATSQNVDFKNVEIQNPMSISYRNYYYFNYSNLNSTSYNSTTNFLPTLSFDASKFKLNISKTVSGNKYSCEISKFNDSLVTLGQTTTKDFVYATYNAQTDKIDIVFNDIGEYVLEYTFVFHRPTTNTLLELTSHEIENIKTKNDVLYILGYQMYFGGEIKDTNEFKALNETKTQTISYQSADVTYLIDQLNANKIKSKNPAVDFESDDQTIKSIIETKEVVPVSTNQPAIVLNSNANLNTALSHFYTPVYKAATSSWDWGEQQQFQDKPFTASGTYLVRLVYNYDTYYSGQSLSQDTQFAQYFFFTIDNTIPSFTVKEDTENGKNLLNASFTKQNAKIELKAQSRFNSQVNLEIYTKTFAANFYTLSNTLSLGNEDLSYTATQEGNYLIKLLYGKNLNKSKTIYFTIDKTAISGLNVVPINKLENGSYEKLSTFVDFFTSENVVVEWNEKQSGAQTKAYYKYVPFTQNTDALFANVAAGALNQGITTTSKLNLNLTKLYDKASYTNAKNRINSSNVFTNQGLYILYVTDEAGHETYTAFCIDRSPIQVQQTDKETGVTKFVTAYDTVSTEKYLAWGDYKLIPVGIKTEEIALLADPWIKTVFESLYNANGSGKADNIRSHSSKLYLSVEICDVYALQTGTSLKLVTTANQNQTTVSPFGDTGMMKYANEITYQFYFMDESNLWFNANNALVGQNAAVSQAEAFAYNADKTFQITTTTDASNAQVLINPTQSINDVSLLNQEAISLSQAGFADSNTATSTLASNLRTKYYFTTGAAISGSVSILSYKLKLTIDDNYVKDVVMYFYPFVTDPITKTKVLSTTATKTIVYDYANPQNSLFTALTGPDNEDYYAFNVNVDYNNLTNAYHTLAGKYVIQRTYNDQNFVNEYDFLIRESVFIVDREDIVSSPEDFEDSAKSAVGGGIFVNILDGHQNAVQFSNIYSAKNNNNTYILQTNKLPVVVYVPTAKYGTYSKDAYNQFTFTKDKTLSKYFLTNGEKLIRYSYLENQNPMQEESYLKMVYFGEIILTDNFAANSNVYNNTDFDLTVTIKSNNGKVIETYKTNVNSIGYITSSPILASGIYNVTITQNSLNGLNYPNVYNTFKFSFQIVDNPPTFAYTENNQTDTSTLFDTDNNGVFYTNEQDKIKVVWTNPTDSTYFASIDTSAKENGTTSIRYYFTNAAAQNISATYTLAATDILTDHANPNVRYFFIDIKNIPNDSILNVYMQNERGVLPEGTSQSDRNLFDLMTSVTKKLYIDRVAPSQILDSLISKTSLNGFTLGSYTRKYINFDGTEATNGERLYNVPVTDGAFARYAFAVTNSEENPLEELFVSKNAVNNFYTEGYYYHIEKVADISEYSPPPNLASAIAATKTFQNQIVQAFTFNTYYEIIEIDLAGNVAIYLIYVTNNDNKNVLQFTSEKTDKEIKNYVNFQDLSSSQNIFAKSFLDITNLSLRDYPFLQFSLDGETYFKSTALTQNQCYTFSLNPQIVNLPELLSFKAPSAHTLIINDSVTGGQYTFNLYITDKQLSYNLLNTSEGIQITAPQSNVLQYLSSITISSYDKGLDKYVVIYDANQAFNSNNFVSVLAQNNSYTFQIINPELAYSYVFYDNYGNKYIEHHTAGSFVLSESDKVKNHLDEVLITENVDGEPVTNTWFVGKNNITYNYSSADYYAYIKIYFLEVTEDKIEWKEFTQTATSPYGIAISDQSNYSITSGNTIFCTIKESSIHQTVKQILLYAPSQNSIIAGFTGGAYKFEITLIDQYDSSNTSVVTDRILINNLSPIIDLKDKNYESVYEDNSIYSEQLTIVIPSLPNSFTQNPQIASFMFEYSSQLIFNSSSSQLTSGTIVEEAGNYEVQIFVKVGQEYHLISSKMFVISESSSAFYEVVVRDPSTGTFVNATKTGKPFTYNQTVCYNHYIVNDEFEVFLNENQMIEEISRIVVENTECTTIIIKLSNFASAKTNNISPYETTIAISRIEQTTSIITNNLFTYETNDGSAKALSGTNSYIAITQSDSDVNHITINFNSYYAIAENIITATIKSENQVWTAVGNSALEKSSFTITNSGDYTISFTDLAGNLQLFTDASGIEQAYFYKIRFIKGVAYLINGSTPIQNAIYNDEVVITLPTTLAGVYDAGGKPTIVVIKNDAEITVKPVNNAYTLNEAGYYKVYFNARVKDQELRQEAYEFLIMSSKEYKSNFEFTEYGDYEIVSVIKNGEDYTSNIRKLYNLSQNDALKNIAISLYDEKTGHGNYTLTIKTNSGIFNETENGLEDESFTFDFIIKSVGAMPLTISINEGESTTNAIYIEFNAFDLYTDIGECIIKYGRNQLKINEEYLNSLTDSYFCSLPITETGTHFIQVYNSSDTLLYSYKVTKTEPLNTVSILLIVGGVLAAAGLTITIVLLRKRMKIK